MINVEITSCEFITTILYKNLEDQVPHILFIVINMLQFTTFAGEVGQSRYSCFAVILQAWLQYLPIGKDCEHDDMRDTSTFVCHESMSFCCAQL